MTCRALMGLQTPVRLLRTRAHVTPMALGIGSPAIVIPDTADAWTLERRRAVLLHELAHIERRDCLTQTLASLTSAVYWIHPGAWWAAQASPGGTGIRVRRPRARPWRRRPRLRGHLLEIAYGLGSGRTPALAVGMARRGQLEGRLLAVLDAARNRRDPSCRPRGADRIVAALAVVLPLAALTTSTHVAGAVLPMLDEPAATARASEPTSPALVAGAPQAPTQDGGPRAARGRSSPRTRPAGCTSNCGRGTRTTDGRSRCRRCRDSRRLPVARSPSH